ESHRGFKSSSCNAAIRQFKSIFKRLFKIIFGWMRPKSSLTLRSNLLPARQFRDSVVIEFGATLIDHLPDRILSISCLMKAAHASMGFSYCTRLVSWSALISKYPTWYSSSALSLIYQPLEVHLSEQYCIHS